VTSSSGGAAPAEKQADGIPSSASTWHQADVPSAPTKDERGNKRQGDLQLAIDEHAVSTTCLRNLDGVAPAPRLVRRRLRVKTTVEDPVTTDVARAAGIGAPSTGLATSLSDSPPHIAGVHYVVPNS
jgi:hypothetical protein